MADADPNLKDRLLNELSTTIEPKRDESLADAPVATPSIPDHTLLRVIGKGSYGEVWLARNVMGTPRAVKIVHRRAFDSDRPYEREFEGIRRFEPVSRLHPSQLAILHMGRDDSAGYFYYIMELADAVENPNSEIRSPKEIRNPNNEDASATKDIRASGLELPSAFDIRHSELYQPRTLRSELQRRGRLPFDECLQIGMALSTALDQLHRHGLVHRDIKPSNIVFVNGIPKLADIGLVARAEATLSMVGTEGYLPPEGPGKPQADIFSLGKVLYEMATGRDRQEYPELPTNLIAQPAAERAQLAELNEIIVRACHTDLKQRYETAAELHADLALLESGKSVSRMRAVERRVRTLARAGAGVTIVAALAGAAFLYQQIQTRKARELARKNLQLAEEKNTLASEKTKLADNLTKLDQENRNRIVRLNIANGVRLLDEGDPAGALLWFVECLPLVTNQPAEESIHRIRIQQTLDRTPRLLRVLPHESPLFATALSPDGRFIATSAQDGKLRVWGLDQSVLVWESKPIGEVTWFVRFSRDGKRVFASSSSQKGMFSGDRATRSIFTVLDAASGKEVFEDNEAMIAMTRDAIYAAFSPDDRWLAVSQKGHVIRVFDLRNGRLLTELRGHRDEVQCLSFSGDGALLASASLDRTVRIWRLPSGEPVGSPLEHRWPIVRVVMTEDGQRLVTASFGSLPAVQAWDLVSRQPLGQPIPVLDQIGMFVAPAHQGRFFVQDSVRAYLYAYSFDQPTEAPTRLEMQSIESHAFNKDGSQLALGNGMHTARIFDTRTGTPVAGPLRHNRWRVGAVEFSPKENQLFTASNDGCVRAWDLRRAPQESARRTFPEPIKVSSPGCSRPFPRTSGHAPIFLGNDTVQIIGDQLEATHWFNPPKPGTTIHMPKRAWHSNIWSFCRHEADPHSPTMPFLWRQDGETVGQFTLQHPDTVFDWAFTRDDRFLVTSCGDGRVRYWRTSDGVVQRTVEVQSPRDGDIVEISSDGRTGLWRRSPLPGGTSENSFRFVDLDSGRFMGRAHEMLGTIVLKLFSPDGQQIAFVDSDGSTTVLESRTGKVISSIIKHSYWPSWAEWDPAGRRLLTTGYNEEVLVWDAQTGAQLFGPLRIPGNEARVAHWSPDGRFIVGHNDRTHVRVWDASTGEAVTPPLEHSGDVQWAFMPRPDRVITASLPDLLRAWDLKQTRLPLDILTDYARLLSGRRLSAAGTLLALKPEELAELNRSLLSRAPQLFE